VNEAAESRARWTGASVLALLLVVLSAWTWNTWADPLVDFGRELETATRLARGEVLYRDVAYLNGPLSPYVNAAALRLGGASLQTLFSFNLLVLLTSAALLWSIARRIAGDLSAFVCTAVLIGLCGFLTLGEVGNYNFVAPYSHELTHGLLLALTTMRLLIALLDRPCAWLAMLLGVVSGLTLLTKPEIAIASVGAVMTGLLLLLCSNRPGLSGEPSVNGVARRRWVVSCVLLGAAFVPVIAWLLLRVAGLSSVEAWRGLLGAWPGTFNRTLHAMPFYQTVAGTSDLSRAVSLMALSAGGWACVVLLGMLAATVALRRGWSVPWTSASLTAGLLLFALAFTSPGHWQVAFRGMSVVVLAASLGHAASFWRSRHPTTIPRLAFCVFALLLLLKIRFNVNLTHYGFVLALPAVCVLAMSLLDWLPGWMNRRGASGWPLRAPALATFTCVFVVYMNAAATFLAERLPIAPGSVNELWVPRHRAEPILRLLSMIEARVPRDSTLVVLPEGALIHAWSGRRSAVPYTTLMPVEMSVFGEDRVLEAFERNPPDFVVLNRTADLAAYGHDSLPSYAPRLSAWLQAEYVDVSTSGLGEEFRLLQHRRSR
jgi:hypothetical protein